jgi:hypothetical protein
MSAYVLQYINPEGDNTVIAVIKRRGDLTLLKRLIQREFDTTWCCPPEDGVDSVMFERYDDGQQLIRIERDGYEDDNDGFFLLEKAPQYGF